MKNINHYTLALQSKISSYVYKRKGWKTDRQIVVVESDDWGAIRMPSLEVLNYLLAKNIKFRAGLGCDQYDTLASNDDLELLMDVLYSVKDKNNNPAKITLNSVMTNPDFKKIKEADYTEYSYEMFTETLKRYPNHDRAFAL